jgi:colicin import membrane protein
MSLNNSQMHGFAIVGTLVLAGSLFATTLYMTEAAEPKHEPALKEMMTIEASLARKSQKQQQPQKEAKAPEPPPPPEPPKPEPPPPEPPPPVKPEGVSRDDTKKPVDKPKDDKKPPPKPAKPDDKPVDLSKFKHASDDEPQPGGKPMTEIGQFDGSEKGFAPLNAGDPYWANLVADFRQVWELPSISKTEGTQMPVGCFHIEADGKIAGVRFDTPSGDEALDDSVQRAMAATRKVRNDKPQPVPTEQLGVIRKWVCFRFKP